MTDNQLLDACQQCKNVKPIYCGLIDIQAEQEGLKVKEDSSFKSLLCELLDSQQVVCPKCQCNVFSLTQHKGNIYRVYCQQPCDQHFDYESHCDCRTLLQDKAYIHCKSCNTKSISEHGCIICSRTYCPDCQQPFQLFQNSHRCDGHYQQFQNLKMVAKGTVLTAILLILVVLVYCGSIATHFIPCYKELRTKLRNRIVGKYELLHNILLNISCILLVIPYYVIYFGPKMVSYCAEEFIITLG